MSVLDVTLNHRSIRNFLDEKLDDCVLGKLYDSCVSVSTSTGTQACSIIHVSDLELKTNIARLCAQDFIAKAPHLFIFVVDGYRNKRIAAEAGFDDTFANSMDIFFQSFSDACIMAQTMAITAQEMGLGICLLGSILNDPDTLSKMLNLPELTFPAIGLVLGKPDETIVYKKPRLNTSMRVFENSYECLEEYLPNLVEYNNSMQEYFAKRGEIAVEGSVPNDFTKMVVKRLRKDIPMRRKILTFARKQGFNLEVD